MRVSSLSNIAMKFLCVAFLCVLGVPQIKCNHEDGIFIKIGSYGEIQLETCGKLFDSILFRAGNNQTETIKEFFLSERFEESWMSAFMFCLKNEMELLRLNSHDELSAFVRAFKYHWLDFGDAVYVDGFKKNDKKWIFLTNKVEIDRRIYDVKKSFDDVDECMLLFKKFAEPSFGTTNCFKTRRKFVCQKVTQGTLENVETGPLKVDVQSRIFEEIGSFADLYTGKDTLSTFYLNRYYDKLSPASASSFCESFNMNLVQVDSMEKLKTMMRHILKQNNRLEENFLIGGSRSTVFENLPLIKLDSFGSHGSGRCLSVTTETRKDNLQIYYFSCAREYDDKPLGFICEKLELNGGAHEETSIESRAIGLKLLGVLPVCKCFRQIKKYS